jgi:large subunit ribosomal protein L30
VTATLRIKQVKSANGASPSQRDTLRTLGLHGIGTVAEQPDNPATRGMVKAVSHLVRTEGEPAVAEAANGG